MDLLTLFATIVNGVASGGNHPMSANTWEGFDFERTRNVSCTNNYISTLNLNETGSLLAVSTNLFLTVEMMRPIVYNLTRRNTYIVRVCQYNVAYFGKFHEKSIFPKKTASVV
jgi:hypothetical protein